MIPIESEGNGFVRVLEVSESYKFPNVWVVSQTRDNMIQAYEGNFFAAGFYLGEGGFFVNTLVSSLIWTIFDGIKLS